MSTNGRTSEFSDSLKDSQTAAPEKNVLPPERPAFAADPGTREDEFLPVVNRWTLLGGILTMAAVGITIILAGVTEYNVTVRARATVRPAGELRLVQATAEGIVKTLLVRENQAVQAGEVIATLDDTRLQIQAGQLQSQVEQAKFQLIQLNAQIRAIETQILAENERIQRAVDSARAEVSRQQRDYRDRQRTALEAAREAQANVASAREEWRRALAELKAARANLKAAEAGKAVARKRSERYRTVEGEGALSRDQLDEVRSAAAQQEQAVEVQKATIEAQERSLERFAQAIEAATARLQQARVALDPSWSEIAIAQAAVKRESAAGEAAVAALKREREALFQQRIALQKQLERDKRQQRQVEREIAGNNIAATADGIIVRLTLRNPGQTVASGEEIARIVPARTDLVIEADVSPTDIGKIQTGQTVQMRVSACPYPDYGTLKGIVKRISQDTSGGDSDGAIEGKARTAYYRVTIEPESLILGGKDNQCTVRLGMEGEADIISRKETVLRFLLRKARLLTDTSGM